MNTTVAYNTTTLAQTSTITETSKMKDINMILIIIYTVVLLVGITGLTLMMSLLKTNIRSVTTIAFLNLMVAHALFLFTVPFRIYYYATENWVLSMPVCKMVSAMVHIHMYMVFTIYSILLTVRWLHFFKKTERTEFYRRLHALGASAVLWILLLLIMVPLVNSQYGNKNNTTDTTSSANNKCFDFEEVIKNNHFVYVLNMFLSVFVIIVSCIHTCIQVVVLRTMILRYGASCRAQQEFWVQIKNLSFVLIMLTCLVPYHLFRLEYLKKTETLQQTNEVFLGITGLACIDMLTFTGKNVCRLC